jgi:hypothetical protein
VYVGFGFIDGLVEPLAQVGPVGLQVVELLAQLLHFADLALEGGVLVLAVLPRTTVELEFLSADCFLGGASSTFFSMSSSILALLFTSRSL